MADNCLLLPHPPNSILYIKTSYFRKQKDEAKNPYNTL
jgi:hypothetical protein